MRPVPPVRPFPRVPGMPLSRQSSQSVSSGEVRLNAARWGPARRRRWFKGDVDPDELLGEPGAERSLASLRGWGTEWLGPVDPLVEISMRVERAVKLSPLETVPLVRLDGDQLTEYYDEL